MDTTQKIKDKWNQLHSNASDRFPEPCSVLKNTSYLLPAAGTALDIACGLGGNALYLAQCGLDTTAIDISEVGISRLQKQASLRDLSIQGIVGAADSNYFKKAAYAPFDVITVSNYLDRDLFKVLPALLKNDGLLFYQTFVKDKADPDVGPSSQQYLLEVNELLALTPTLECRLFYDLGSTGQLTKGLRNQSCIIAQKESKVMSSIKTFLGMLEKGPDNVLLRYSLGNAYYQDKQYSDAILHLLKATEQDPLYSAAWKALGRCYFDSADYQKAAEVYERGIKVAADKGDRQAEKEMTVFLRRSRKKMDLNS